MKQKDIKELERYIANTESRIEKFPQHAALYRRSIELFKARIEFKRSLPTVLAGTE